MADDVNPFPEDLRQVCRVATRNEVELTALMPPAEVIQTVIHPAPEPESVEEVTRWVALQEKTWSDANEVLEKLAEIDADAVVPDWYLEAWAYPLRSKWSAGLEDAVTAAKQWLAQKSI